MKNIVCDIAILGGGTGGVAAALAASNYGLKTVLIEQYKWIGGQLTAQAVPPDEHPWIEVCGCTKSYREFRNRVRAYYSQHYPHSETFKEFVFNPGGGFVSALCCQPRFAHKVLMDMLDDSITNEKLQVLNKTIPVAAETDGDIIKSVLVQNLETGDECVISAKIFIDCTELGDLLPLVGAEYVSGAESRSDTNEAHAPELSDPGDVQGFTWCFAAAFNPGRCDIIDRPDRYSFWSNYMPTFDDTNWPGKLLDWTACDPQSLAARVFNLFELPMQKYNSLWLYRQIVSCANLGAPGDDVTLVNWPQNDYFLTNIIDQPKDDVQNALDDARQLSLSLLYWMQTEAPRPDGGVGYPGLYLASDVLGTSDGFAIAPYIRESRRIQALFTVREGHLGTQMRREDGFQTAAEFPDTVGIGSYRIDLHPSPAGRNYIDISSLPFQIPMGSLIPVRLKNLLAGNKNIGTTHITNGCYRLHPVEWNIGESAGHLAGYSLSNNSSPHNVFEDKSQLVDFQNKLVEFGVELSWPHEIAVTPR